MRPARAAIYRRVSTEEQAAEGLSLETQEQRDRAFCTSQGWMVAGVYTDDSTGLDINRGGYRRMLEEKDSWDVAVAVKRDRFHRSVDNAREFIKWVRRNRKQVWSIAEGRVDTTKNAAAWLVSQMQEALPEFESRQISERVLPSMELAKEKGLHQGRPPVGFVWVKPLKKFVPTEWAKRVAADAESYGPEEAGRLNPYPDGKLKGKRPSRSTVYKVLLNLREYELGLLVPNRDRTPTGSHSKFREAER